MSNLIDADELMHLLHEKVFTNYTDEYYGTVQLINELIKKNDEHPIVLSPDLNKVKTKGDVIRESNEMLAEFINVYAGCEHCIYTSINGNCCAKCVEGITAYLNQPEESEE